MMYHNILWNSQSVMQYIDCYEKQCYKKCKVLAMNRCLKCLYNYITFKVKTLSKIKIFGLCDIYWGQ
jgi:hypothetical protein